MHKIRNTKHLEILNSMVGIIAPGCSEPLSKRTLRTLLQLYKWDKKKVLKLIEDDEWWCHWADE